MKDSLVETLAGFIVLVGATAFIIYGYSVVETDRTDGMRLLAKFDRVDGLAIGSDVRLSGIKIGTVAALRLDPQSYEAEVSMLVDASVALPDDSSAKITSEGLLGGNYIALSPGGGLDMLGEGDEILYTQGAVDLIGLVGRALFDTGNAPTQAD